MELIEEKKTGISKISLLKLLKEQILNGDGYEDDTLTIVETFGGINNVLSTYLESQNIPLCEGQLIRIHQILSTPTTNQHSNRVMSSTQITHSKDSKNRNVVEDGKSFCYTFDPNNHYLNNVMINILYHKCTIIFFIITTIFGMALQLIFGSVGTIYSLYTIVIGIIFRIPFQILLLLSFNKKAMRLLTKSFDFWIKSVYGTLFGVVLFIYENNKRRELTGNIGILTATITLILLVIIIGSFDAVSKLKVKWKVAISTMFALFFSFRSIFYQFIESEMDDYVIPIKTTNSSLSFQSLLSSLSRIIAIFLWKQAINAYLRKSKCISIRYTPYIEWMEEKHVQINSSTSDMGTVEAKHNIPTINLKRIKKMNIKMKGNEESISLRLHDSDNTDAELVENSTCNF